MSNAALIGRVLFVLTFAGAIRAQSENDVPNALPEELRAAWQKAGYSDGWIRRDGFTLKFRLASSPGKQGDVPAFGVGIGRAGTLPAPGQAFGIYESALVTNPDTVLKELAGFKQLRSLRIENARLTDEGMRELAKFPDLLELDLSTRQLSSPVITEAGAKELGRLKQLRMLKMKGVKVTDAVMKELAGLNELETFSLETFDGTEKGLKALRQLKRLQALQIVNAIDGWAKEISALDNLHTLSLCSMRITDAGARELGGLKQLRSLDLSVSQVTDVGLEPLTSLKSVRKE